MLKYFIIFIIYFTAIFSLIIIAAWLFNTPLILSFLPGFITIKFSTALAFFLSSLILYFAFQSLHQKFSSLSLIIVSFSILIIWIMMVTILVSIIFNFKSGIENLFVRDVTMAAKLYVAGQPSLAAILAFLLVTIMGLNIFYEGQLKSRIFLILGFLVFLIGFSALIGVILSWPWLYYDIPSISNPISIPASLLFSFLGLAFFLLSQLKAKV